METATFKQVFDNYDTHYKSVDNDWNPAEASCFTLINDEWALVDTEANPYELLEQFVYHGFDGTSALTMHGWAAPLSTDDDLSEVRPSQHIARRRCRIHIIMNKKEWQCAVAFSDMPDELDHMGEQGVGGVADAISLYLEQIEFGREIDQFNQSL